MSRHTNVLVRNLRPIGFDAIVSHTMIDVLIDENGLIAGVGSDQLTPVDTKVIDGKGAYVCPGWMDLHVHVYFGATDLSIRGEDCGLNHGVTTLLDTGSAGEANFPGFRAFIAQPAPERIYALLNIGSIGLVAANRVSEVPCLAALSLDRTLDCIESNRDLILGIKVRASRQVLGALDMLPVKLAKKAAELTGLPLMVHIGDPPALVEDILDILTPGDIVTHCFHGKAAGTSFANNKPLLERARQAVRDGVIFDVGHGRSSFSYEVAKECMEQGFIPQTISSDLHVGNLNKGVIDLASVMSKMLALGMPLEDVITKTTVAPRAAVKLRDKGFLSPGEPADLTLFDVENEDEVLIDSHGQSLRVEKMISPRLSILGTNVVPAARRLANR